MYVHTGFEALADHMETGYSFWVMISGDVTSCVFVDRNRTSGASYCLDFQDNNSAISFIFPFHYSVTFVRLGALD